MMHMCFWNTEILTPIQKYGMQGPGAIAFKKLRVLLDRIMLLRTKMQRLVLPPVFSHPAALPSPLAPSSLAFVHVTPRCLPCSACSLQQGPALTASACPLFKDAPLFSLAPSEAWS